MDTNNNLQSKLKCCEDKKVMGLSLHRLIWSEERQDLQKPDWVSNILKLYYRTHAIITRGLYTFYPLFEVHLCTVTFGLMYG